MISFGILLLLLSSYTSQIHGVLLQVESFEPIPMGSVQNVTLRVTFDPTSETEEFEWSDDKMVKLTFRLTNNESWAVNVLNESLQFNRREIRKGSPKKLALEGVIIGVDNLQIFSAIIYSKENPSTSEADIRELLAEQEVRVVLRDRALNTIFTGVMTFMIIANTINMGGQLDLDIIKAVLSKPVGPLVGFASQFLFMPLFSYGVGWLLFDDKLFRLGLFVLGSCPGGTGSNFWCILLNGDLNLSITMTFISTVAALGMMPLWLFLLGSTLTEGDLVIPYSQLIITLVFLVAPVALGMWIRYRWTQAAKWMAKIIIPVTLITVIFIFTAGIYLNLFIFLLMTGRMVLAGFLVAGAGYVFGAFLAWVFRLKMPQITAVSIETAFQNGGIAFILLRLSLPEPFGDLASVAPVAQLMITGSPLWLIFFAIKIHQKCFPKPPITEDETDEVESKITEKNIEDGIPRPEMTKPLITMASVISAKEENV